MDTFSEPLSDSETTGTACLDSEGESSIGARPGATGPATTPTVYATLEEVCRARAAKHEAEVRKAIESKTWLKHSIDKLAGEWKPPAPLREYESAWLPPSLSEDQGAELAPLLAEARCAAAPAGEKAAAVILLQLMSVVIVPETAAPDAMMAAYIEDLSDIPADLLNAACRRWRRSNKFWPTISELLEECHGRYDWEDKHDSRVADRRSRLFRLEALDSVRRNPAPNCIVTEEWHRERTADGRDALAAPTKPQLTIVR